MSEAYRPPGWSNAQLFFLRATFATHEADVDGVNIVQKTVDYFFDAVLRADHSSDLAITRHPVQSGANVSDHAYMLPGRLALDIGMSDAMDRYTADSYTSDASKSVSAFKTLEDLQQKRMPLQVVTRLKTYNNMLIKSIRPVEDFKTRHALRAVVEFEQIIVGRIDRTTVSARPGITDTTERGTQQVSEPSAALKAGNWVSRGASGSWSSRGRGAAGSW